MRSLLLHDVEVEGRTLDVLVDEGRIVDIGSSLGAPHLAEVVRGDGGALLPGLWDHHIHLVALAAARRSTSVGPPDVRSRDDLARVLRDASRGSTADAWIRGVGYHESVAGELDRDVLDGLVPDRPARIQHRSGALWILNSVAVERVGLDEATEDGIERDGNGRPTGRLFGADRWLRDRLDPESPPDLAEVGAHLASCGVVGVTDATPYDRLRDLDVLAGSASTGALPQHVVAMGGPALTRDRFPAPLRRGPTKLLLADHALPSLDALVGWISAAHAAGRPIAAHCVTRTSLVLALAALDVAGPAPGDRIEHGAVVPPELREHLERHRLTVVTQPNFVAERGDQYLTDVDADDRPHLYPCRSLLEGGVPVAGSTDAPFGDPDPWRSIAAAVDRRTVLGEVVGADERVPGPDALRLFLGAPDDPGRVARTVTRGAPADLCLLDAPLADALAAPAAERVRMTIIGGRIVHARERP